MIKKVVRFVDKKCVSLARKSSFFAGVYFLIRSYGFGDEQRAVLSGRHSNIRGESTADLRRNIHRIEKGLITRPRKPVFAKDYILNTVKELVRVKEVDGDNSLIHWGCSVLEEYFSVVGDDSVVSKSKMIFLDHFERQNRTSTFIRSHTELSGLTIEQFERLNVQRRSVRYYKDIPVPRHAITECLKVALQAPSACNRQPFNFRIIDDESKLREATRLPAGIRTFADNVKVLVFLIGELNSYFDERDKHLIYIDGGLVTMNFILALETAGLSSCVVNWGDRPDRNRKLAKFLGLKDYERCVVCLSIGYASENGGIPGSRKKTVEEIVKYN